MSRFHFDESAVETVMSSFCGIMQNIRDCANALNNISMELCDYEGFNIGYAIESINNEKNIKFRICANTLETGYNVLRCIQEKVVFYSHLAAMKKSGSEFVESVTNQTLGKEFDKYNHYVTECINENNNFLTALSIGLNFDDLFKDTISGLIKTGKLDGVDRKNCRNALISVLDSLTQNEDYLDVKIAEGINDALKEALKELKMCKTLSPDLMKKMPKEIQDFFKDIGRFADIQKLGGEIVSEWFEDYTVAMSYFDTLTTVASGGAYDQMTMDVINELKAEYSNKFFQSVNSILDFAIDKTSGKLIDKTADILSYGGTIYSILDFTADLAAEYSGCADISDNYYQLSGLIILDSHVNAEYKNVAQQIQNGNLSSEILSSYNNLFELKRSIQISKFETMMKMTDSSKLKSEYEAVINELKNMTSGI